MNTKVSFAVSLVGVAALSGVAGYLLGKHPHVVPQSSSSSDAVGTVRGASISRSQLTGGEAFRVYEAETQVYNAMTRIIEERYMDAFFDHYMTEKKLPSRTAAQEAYFHENSSVPESRVLEVVQQFGSDDRLKNLSPEDQKKEVRHALEMQQSQNTLRTLVQNAKRKGEISVAFPEPIEPALEVTDGGNPSVGPKDAKVTIVEFADYECPFCARVVPTLWDLTKKYEGKVRWVFRDYPLPFHKNSVPAAIAANCAGVQGKYFEAHNYLFEHHTQLNEDTYKGLAETLKLDATAFNTCRAGDEQKKEVEADYAAGEKLGVNGTPTYFVNGKRMKPGASMETFTEMIDQELAKK